MRNLQIMGEPMQCACFSFSFDHCSMDIDMLYSVYYQGEISISPPLSENDAAITLAISNQEETDQTRAIFEAIAASPQSCLPAYRGLFTLSDDRALIIPKGDESRHGLRLCLLLLIEYFFNSSGYVLNGQIFWEGDEFDDRGWIFVKDNQVEAITDQVVNAGPSWSPDHYTDPDLKQRIQSLVDSANGEGRSNDVTVVSSASLDALRCLLPLL
jgi:hypothetical protein